MSDIEIIEKLSDGFDWQLKKINNYSWDRPGYVIGSQGRIEVLNLHLIEIANLPEEIGGLSELKVLHLVSNKLTSVSAIENLKKLKILVLQNNLITNIKVLSNLEHLEELILSYNPIINLDSLKNVNSIRKLSILSKDSPINLEPITLLNNLEELSISDIDSKSLNALVKCEKLRDLSIFPFDLRKRLSNDIYKYLEKLKLTSLTISNVSSINIKKIANLSQLKELYISVTDLIDISAISKMENLEVLSLSYNEIEDIKSLTKLTKLTELNLSSNKIKDISPISSLKNLRTVNLSDNPITDLSPLLPLGLKFIYKKKTYKSIREKRIFIAGCNEITNPPIEIARFGDNSIRRYFKKIEEEGLDYIFEAKLLLVGEGSAGKTSLQKRLINDNAPLPTGENRTRGIEVVDLEINGGIGIIKTIHIWDFGGQDVYYPVHRFFITENSVFVLLASTRQPFHNFDYWIPTIFQFGGKSPVIIGQTCHQGNIAPWNELDLYVSSPNFNIVKTLTSPFYRLDLTDNNLGLKAIKDVIINQIENLHHFGKGVPKSWLEVRTILKNEKVKSCIPFERFKEICRGLKNFVNIKDIEDCCLFLHNIGVLLWYSQIEELKDWVILEPEWAMNAVYRIIDDLEIQQNNGIIHPQDFTRLWKDQIYEGKYSVLKKLLLNFKMAFPTKHSEGDYIMPARLTSLSSDKRWALEKKDLRLEYNFEFMPRGIVNQLSAELSRYIWQHDVWNNGVNLAYDNNNTRSQIVEDFYNRKLSIISKGIDARGMNILIMNSLRNIIDSYKGVKEEIYVTCICDVCQKLGRPTTFLYGKLVEWSIKRQDGTVSCNESGEALKISELLFNNGLADPVKNNAFSKSDKIETNKKVLRIFLASSSELEKDRKEIREFISVENDRLIDEGIYLKLIQWEYFLDAMSTTRLQDEYNKEVEKCDVFLGLFFTKVGMYTLEEFEKAYGQFIKTQRPKIFTYFKTSKVDIEKINQQDVTSKTEFQNRLKSLGHFPTKYKNISDLKFKLKAQLEKLINRS